MVGFVNVHDEGGFSFGGKASVLEAPGQSRPDFGLGFQVKLLQTFPIVPSSLGSGFILQWHLT